MKKEIIQQLYSAFEQAALEVDGVECWSARELQKLLGYSKWENFANVIDKAKTACENVGHNVSEHFPDVRKTIPMPKGAEKEIDDYLLTRYACYLVAQNGDPRKEQIVSAAAHLRVEAATLRAEIEELKSQL
jgi:DNA-damage-inducible protein D